VHTYGLTQAVGPVQPIPPHCPHSTCVPVEVGLADVLVLVVVVERVVLVLETVDVLDLEVEVAVLVEEELETTVPPVVITNVTTEYAGRVKAPMLPPLIVVANVVGTVTELSI
jgi:hypothetical protein